MIKKYILWNIVEDYNKIVNNIHFSTLLGTICIQCSDSTRYLIFSFSFVIFFNISFTWIRLITLIIIFKKHVDSHSTFNILRIHDFIIGSYIKWCIKRVGQRNCQNNVLKEDDIKYKKNKLSTHLHETPNQDSNTIESLIIKH